MLLVALLLIPVAAGVLSAAVSTDQAGLAYVALVVSLLAATLLAVGVARSRPRRGTSAPTAPTWSGAVSDPAATEE